jgi:hypothetical protein
MCAKYHGRPPRALPVPGHQSPRLIHAAMQPFIINCLYICLSVCLSVFAQEQLLLTQSASTSRLSRQKSRLVISCAHARHAQSTAVHIDSSHAWANVYCRSTYRKRLSGCPLSADMVLMDPDTELVLCGDRCVCVCACSKCLYGCPCLFCVLLKF